MEYVWGDLLDSRPRVKGVGLTIGNFDGVHRGHQRLVNQLVNQCEEMAIDSAVLSFSPHPAEVFDQDHFFPLSTMETKKQRLERLNLNWLFIQKFNLAFSEVTASEFLSEFIMPFFQPKLIVFGYDFRFGKNGKGGFSFAQKYLSGQSVELLQLDPLKIDEKIVSSSLIRKKIASGDIRQANGLLGYQYSIQGQVVRGQSLGRKIGFPTANLSGVLTQTPGNGVYQVDVVVKGGEYQGIVNIGTRPTVDQQGLVQLECHILDFQGDLYDEKIRIFFVDKIRSEKKFSGIEELKKQIALDVKLVKQKLGKA